MNSEHEEVKYIVAYRGYYGLETCEEAEFATHEEAVAWINKRGCEYDNGTVFLIFKLDSIAERSAFNIRKVD